MISISQRAPEFRQAAQHQTGRSPAGPVLVFNTAQ